MVERPADLEAIAASLPQGTVPLPDVVTSGQPTARQLEAVGVAGVRTVLDLRRVDEPRDLDEPETVHAAGMEYVHLPMGYEGVPDAIFATVREVLNDPTRRPVLFHCASANRVGAALLPHLVLDHGLELEAALERAVAVGLRHQGIAEAALAYAARAGGSA
jgi:protein tyrosine phosphatase (PTP) superfamily phosphohydrolase (DUF442 family)